MPDNPADQKAEEARREITALLRDAAGPGLWAENQPAIEAATDRAILLAKLEQAEECIRRVVGHVYTGLVMNETKKLVLVVLGAERDRLRREVEEKPDMTGRVTDETRLLRG